MNTKNAKDTKHPNFKGYIFDEKEMMENNHTKLISHDNNTITYLNNDGTKTIYISSTPIEEKRLHIKESNDKYVSEGRNINVELPKNLSMDNGINIGGFINVYPSANTGYFSNVTILSHKGSVLPLRSEFKDWKNIFGQIKECVEYKDFYNNDSLYCYTTSFGLNMEMVIPEYNGNNIYSLMIKQPEGFFVEEEPDFVLFRNEEDIKSMIYTSLAVDSNGAWNYNNRINLSFEDNGICYVHFILDEDFLKDRNTKFPVTINQSINAYKHKQPDSSIYSGAGEYARHYLSPFMLLGDKTVKGEGWAMLRYEALYDMDLIPEDIVKAEYYFSNLFDLKDSVDIGAYAIINDWCSVNTRWNSKPDYDYMPLQITTIKKRGFHNMDITPFFVEIMSNKYEYEPLHSIRNSFFIRSDTQDSNLLVAAGDSGINTPYLKVIVR